MILIILTWNWLKIELITWRPVLKKSRMSARQSAAPRAWWRRWPTVRKSTKNDATPRREKYVAVWHRAARRVLWKVPRARCYRVLLCECKGTSWEICHEEPLQECVLEFNEVCSTEDDEECHNVPAHPALNFIIVIPAIQFWKSCDCNSTKFSSWWATFLLQRHQEGWETQHQIDRTNLSLPAVLLNSSSNELSIG